LAAEEPPPVDGAKAKASERERADMEEDKGNVCFGEAGDGNDAGR
jgi:hypothetical protein